MRLAPSPIAFRVNGADVAVEAPPMARLSSVLRDRLGLTGTKVGCDAGDCGACTVLVDGAPVYSCTRPVHDLAGRAVTTIEGLSRDGRLDPLQEAFVAEQAGQCGYCLSGIILSARALLDATPHPTRAEIVAALDRHLCRCGSHNRILRAVERAAAQGSARRG